ncbi:MAG: tRNA uridine-5-carboxymethylaminomethyl(34) synthesis enzyme MnmG [Omnitrophica bacterium RIFCSPHIGHO2_02_FULL_46_11]|nr:MAG: tRNA uridine-5-carboxymethylaminomethyl(34) synthesis enzyme MnmG [Omnitrophica bacterium RIFCSPHIGHO2_02_FULL_46_11]OGW87444.1 MAG: tRNA uridine-5-carboxymethylaminomethyl(34) synthesis enzyme MnmG [Omnitrophica bacterium RIFCSPLOWO2_01_FULL_45_10b]
MIHDKKYDSIVIGAGHAGTEAALSIARTGYQVLFLTMNLDSICQMSCNPAIGGLAKGHVVREMDALGGEMALAIDHTALQFRMLNKSKGPAVWAPRAQADKKNYQRYMKQVVESERNIDLKQDQAVELLVKDGKAIGVRTMMGIEYYGETIVVTTGTFMRGLIHVGDVNYPGGRGGDPPSLGLSDSLKAHGFEVVRFKTGTPCRLRKNSIDFSVCEEQPGDVDPEPFSFRTKQLNLDQLSCWLTYTNEKTHEIVRKNLHRSPLYAGRIEGIGPRYCPSVEDKVVKFADKPRHQIYLEPEGRNTEEFYVNGLSTSLPQDVQIEMVHSIPGLEHAELMRFGYAIEYDCMPPTQLKHSLETKKIENLFFAGQVNCTSGYEEAGAQGLMAGLNVIRKLKRQDPFVLDRSEAYIGVLIDDLVTRGTNEPYRLFTSRAEFRLLLRQDNADERLMKYGFAFGLIQNETYQNLLERKKTEENIVLKLRETKFESNSFEKLLRRTDVTFNSLLNNGLDLCEIDENIYRKVEWDIKYEGYIKRQLADVAKFKKLEKRKIPDFLDYSAIRGLSREAKEKFSKVKPVSLGQASRIPGMSSCDISVLLVYIEKLARVSPQ